MGWLGDDLSGISKFQFIVSFDLFIFFYFWNSIFSWDFSQGGVTFYPHSILNWSGIYQLVNLDILYYFCQDIHHNSFGGYWLVYPAWKCSNIHIKTNIFVVIQPWLRSSTVTSIRQVWDRLLGIAPKGVPKIHAGRLPELRLPVGPQRIGCSHQLTHSVHGDKYWDYCIECISKWPRNRWSRDGEKLLAKGFKVYNIVTILLVFKEFFFILLYEWRGLRELYWFWIMFYETVVE